MNCSPFSGSACLKAVFPRFLALAAAGVFGSVSIQAQGNGNIILATTTSVRDAGLLDVLLPLFTESTGDVVKVVAVGSGHAMEMGRRGEVDILILHDPAGEEQFLAEGYGIDRFPLMYNEFLIVGPSGDPARVRGLGAVEALAGIAASKSRFLSRGDNSGTHVKEETLWERSGQSRERQWYWESGQGMSATLQIAAEINAYVLTDIATYLRHPAKRRLDVMVSGDSALFNPYHVMLVNPGRFDGLNVESARRLWFYLGSSSIRELIAGYGVREFGRPLFLPDAGHASR